MNYPTYTPVADMRIRMQCLPRRLRIAHLRALMVRLSPRSIRRQELVALLRDEWAAQPPCEGRSA
jgi:hypothetical protein